MISVDLPAPFSPSSAWTSPARTSNETPESARTPGNVFSISRTSSSGAALERGVSLQRRAHAASVARVSGSTTIVSTPASRSMASASGGAARSVMSAWMRAERTNDEAAALGEFRSVRQHDQLVGAPQKFHLRARDQRIALDHAMRADRDRAHEHDARRIVLDRVVIERRDNDFLVAIDLAARQSDAVLRFPDEKLGERVGVGQDLEPGWRKNSAIWNVVVPPLMMIDVAVLAHFHGATRDGAFRCDVDRPS